MKRTLTLALILSFLSASGGWAAVAVAPTFSISVQEGLGYDGYTFSALNFTSDEQGGNDSIILSSDGTESGAALDLTTQNLYFDGKGTTTITGATLENSKEPANGRTATYYAFVAASGGVTFDHVTGADGTAVDLQQNLSIGTAWTNYNTAEGTTPAVLTIANGSKIATTAYYNSVGSNGSRGVINVTGAGSELYTQQITLGAGTAGMTSAPGIEKTSTAEEKSTYWYPACFYPHTDYQDLVEDSANFAKGDGVINITDGGTMTVGKDNANSSNNRLQVFNGEVRINGKDGEGNASTLYLANKSSLTLSANYGERSFSGINSVVQASDGGQVKMLDGATLQALDIGVVYASNEVSAALRAEGKESSMDIKASVVFIGGIETARDSSGTTIYSGDGGSSETTVAASDGASISIASTNSVNIAVYDGKTEVTDNTTTVSATGGSSVELSAAKDIYVGWGAKQLEASFEASGKDSSLKLSAQNIFVNYNSVEGEHVTFSADDGATLELEGTASADAAIEMGRNTEVSITNGATLRTTGGLLLKDNATATVDGSSSWEAASVSLKDTASITNYGDFSVGSLTLEEGTAFYNYGTVSLTSAASMAANSSTTFVVTQGGDDSLTSTKIALNGQTLTLEDGAKFVIDFRSLATGEYSDITLTLMTGILDATTELTEDKLKTLLGNTTYVFADGVWAESANFQYSVTDNNLILSGIMSLVPEPATATLSLLALAVLAVRRRRKEAE